MIEAIAKWVLHSAPVAEEYHFLAMELLTDWIFSSEENQAYAEKEGFSAAWRAMESERKV